MRIRYAVATLFIFVAATISFSVIGQEDALPAVQPRAVLAMNGSDAGFALVEPTVALVVEPFHSSTPPTLAEAARANDFATFDTLFREAERRGQNVSPFRPLHELWTWSQNDSLGAFYGSETHDRLARAYPGYARFIDDYRIVDQRGNVFYPTSETRTFLLDRALEGQLPRVLIADSKAPRPAQSETATRAPEARRTITRTASAAAHRSRTAGTAKASSVKASTHAAPVHATEPSAATPTATPAPAPVVATAPAPVAAVPAPSISVPVAPTAETQPAPVVAEQQRVPDAPVTAPAASESPFRSRGILLLVIGLVGVGLLALMLRAPQEMPTSIINAAPPEKPAAPVQPIRPAGGEQSKKPRANAS